MAMKFSFQMKRPIQNPQIAQYSICREDNKQLKRANFLWTHFCLKIRKRLFSNELDEDSM
jgi:hypothetical protein